MDEALKAFLLDPASFGLAEGAEIRHVQTHISDVFVAGKHVYKVKKSVNFGFLDFTSLEKRRYFIQQEIELNRRLAAGVYEGAVAILKDKNGSFRLSERPEDFDRAVEYALKMKRLDDAWSLKAMLGDGRLKEHHIVALAKKLQAFYANGPLDEARSVFGEPAQIKRNTDENFEQTLPYIGFTLSEREYRAIEAFTNSFLVEHRELLQRRVQEGFIRDCHGDLHADHVYFPPSGEVLIIDQIEFNERFRFHDVASDVAFLTMDLTFQGFPNWAKAFKRAFTQETNDKDLLELLPFYEAYRAYVRGKVEGFSLEKDSAKPGSKAFQRVRGYFRLAYRRALGISEPLLLVVLGPMGSGKTTLAMALSEALDIPTLSTDKVRKELAGIGEQRHYVPFGEGIYSTEFSQRTYEELAHRALGHIKAGRSIIIEGGFPGPQERTLPLAKLKRAGIHARTVFIACEASKATLVCRLQKRQLSGEQVADGRTEILESQLASFASLPVGIEAPLLRVWSEKPLASQVERILKSNALKDV